MSDTPTSVIEIGKINLKMKKDDKKRTLKIAFVPTVDSVEIRNKEVAFEVNPSAKIKKQKKEESAKTVDASTKKMKKEKNEEVSKLQEKLKMVVRKLKETAMLNKDLKEKNEVLAKQVQEKEESSKNVADGPKKLYFTEADFEITESDLVAADKAALEEMVNTAKEEMEEVMKENPPKEAPRSVATTGFSFGSTTPSTLKSGSEFVFGSAPSTSSSSGFSFGSSNSNSNGSSTPAPTFGERGCTGILGDCQGFHFGVCLNRK